MNRRLALFDLDNTLLAGDSDHAWGEFLISRNLVDEVEHREANDGFYADYLAGVLDIHAWLAFTLGPVRKFAKRQRDELLAEFVGEYAKPMVLKDGLELVREHRRAGDFCMILTATNDLITRPIAKLFEVDALLATEAEIVDGEITGRIHGTPCFQEGKVRKLRDWLSQNPGYELDNSVFYSDSINDQPLLELAGEAVAVDPDPRLAQLAQIRGWKTITLRPWATEPRTL
ncbi:MAG: HAD family hydrolase [Gammaproteobacteria bacterium]|nr:HAD family hydrolase [Gammaproteobacteria bacterium]MYH46655.1 HAD family hydrolase [Gammaproteobacteria bacterium]MYL13603.1 HAD family hydrolase [Gammaproteobacteria bacterium]